jgi:hypothetical protein
MTKIRQYVSFVMAVIIMNSAFNPYSVTVIRIRN